VLEIARLFDGVFIRQAVHVVGEVLPTFFRRYSNLNKEESPMKTLKVVRLLLVALCSAVALPAWAAPITPLYYDMPNGTVGIYTYPDDSYTCAGIVACSPPANNTVNNAPLFGGKGDLTDGVVATLNWFDTPGLYVGWYELDPTIHFVFDGTATISSVRLYFDDANAYGAVSLPDTVTFTSGVNTITHLVTDPLGSAPVDFTFDVSSLGAVGSIDVYLHRKDYWVFMSEATFDGGSHQVPEPSTFLLIGSSLVGSLGYGLRRQRKV